MLASQEKLLTELKAFTQSFLRLAERSSVFLYHNDSDGLASGAILQTCFERRGIPYRAYCLEKLYPEVLTHLFKDPLLEANTPFLLADFGSGILPLLEELKGEARELFVLDHHHISGSAKSQSVHLINPSVFGLSGDKNASASSLCYLFAKEVSRFNTDLAELGVLGALGDGHHLEDARLHGLNQIALEEAMGNGLVERRDGKYYFTKHGLFAGDFNRYVGALGSFAYLDGGPDIALKGLTEEFDLRYWHMAEQHLKRYQSLETMLVENLQIDQTKAVQWFRLGEEFSDMGVETVGILCETLAESDRVNPELYICGFQKIPPLIPGVGEFNFAKYKVSMRLPARLRSRLAQNEVLPLTAFLAEAAARVGGFSDALRPHAGSVTIPIGTEEQFLVEVEDIVYAH